MEPIPYFYDSIDRNAIVVKAKKPFFDWVNSVFDDEQQIEDHENNIYLIKEMDSNEHVLKWIKQNFDKIFVNELNDWCTDEDFWPEHRDYRTFQKWFDIEICSMILDIEDKPVTKL